MYLEISGRQTGKTMRLVAEVNRFLGENPDHVACIIVGTGGMIRDFHRRFPADINDFRGNNPCPRIHIRTSYKELVNSFRNPRGGRVVAEENIRWFWDEFDYHSLREVPVLEPGTTVAPLNSTGRLKTGNGGATMFYFDYWLKIISCTRLTME